MSPHEDPKRWKALAVLGIAYLMVVLDVSIVNVALPSIQKDLHFHSNESLQWVVSGYALSFGGLLLLGRRSGDLLGRRRVFMAGLLLFSICSLICGLSVSSGMLIAARVAQGAAGAILSPSVFSIVTVTFEEGPERNKALGILGGIAGSGAAVGVAACPLEHLPPADADGGERHRVRARHRDLRHVLHALAVHAAGARLFRVEDGSRVSGDRAHGRRRIGGLAGPRDTSRREAGAERWARPARGRPLPLRIRRGRRPG